MKNFSGQNTLLHSQIRMENILLSEYEGSVVITANNIFKTSENLYLRIQTIEQRIKKLEHIQNEGKLTLSEKRELEELNAKIKPLAQRLTEIHQQILDYSLRIHADTERFVVIEYFVNHTPRPVIASQEYYDRSWIYKIIKKYQKL